MFFVWSKNAIEKVKNCVLLLKKLILAYFNNSQKVNFQEKKNFWILSKNLDFSDQIFGMNGLR